MSTKLNRKYEPYLIKLS